MSDLRIRVPAERLRAFIAAAFERAGLAPAEMFDDTLAAGPRVAMLATFPPGVAGMEAEFRARALGRPATLRTVWIPEAMDAARGGDTATQDTLLAAAARDPANEAYDALMLAHFSVAPAAAAVQVAVPFPVLTSPASAVRRLRARLEAT